MPRALGWAEFLAAQGTRTAPTNQVHLPAASWHSSSRSQIQPFAVKLAPGLQASACRLARPSNLARAWLSSALSCNCAGATARSQLAHLLKVQSKTATVGLASTLAFLFLSFLFVSLGGLKSFALRNHALSFIALA